MAPELIVVVVVVGIFSTTREFSLKNPNTPLSSFDGKLQYPLVGTICPFTPFLLVENYCFMDAKIPP